MDEELPTSLAVIAGQYQTKVTDFQPVASGIIQVLAANPKRWYVAFLTPGGVGTIPMILPSPVPPTIPGVAIQIPMLEWKFRDSPAIVTGSFFGNWFAGARVFIVEQLFTRG